MRRCTLVALTIACLVLAACSSGPVRRISEPAASIQQLTVQADGSWSVDLRLQNYSSIPMRFDAVALEIVVGGESAGTLRHQPALDIGPESADVVTATFSPSSAARILVADALTGRRSFGYELNGTIDATPTDRGGVRSYDVERTSALNPVPGLPGVLR